MKLKKSNRIANYISDQIPKFKLRKATVVSTLKNYFVKELFNFENYTIMAN